MAESSCLHYHLFVRENVLRYIHERGLLRAGDRVCIGVSGGADSVALLRVLLELRSELGIVISVAHFNHGLRGEASEADETFVAELARQHELEFFSGCGDVRDHALTNKLSLEAAAREMRYRWLTSLAESHKLNAIATGHTLDDQAETVLLKFLRGAGTRGLGGIYPTIAIGSEAPDPLHSPQPRAEAAPLYRDDATRLSSARIIRPLLEVTRDEVERYLASLGQGWREDESNLNHRFTRNRVRHELLPLLESEYNPNIRQMLSDVAEVSRAEEEFWQALVERELQDRLVVAAEPEAHTEEKRIPRGLKPARDDKIRRPSGTAEAVPLQSSAAEPCLGVDSFAGLPLALQRRLLKRLLESQQIPADFEHIKRLRRCALGELPQAELPGGWLAVRRGQCLELRAPQADSPISNYEYRLLIPGEVHIAELGLTVRAVPVPQAFAQEAGSPESLLSVELLGAELIVRNWRPGDRFWPVHSKSEEKLKRLFSEQHIPAKQRQSWPVVLCDSKIVWVKGFPVARAFAWSGSGDALKIELLGNR